MPVQLGLSGHKFSQQAGRAASPDPDAAHEGPALLATLIANCAAATAVALIDRDRPPRTGHRDNEARSACVAASPVSKRPARVRAEPAATDRTNRCWHTGQGS